jgi:hypothetical protein
MFLGRAAASRVRRRVDPATSAMITVYVQLSESAMQIRLRFCRLQKGVGQLADRFVDRGASYRLSIVSQRRLAG